jgi:ATP-dependent RNA helicase DOB1
MPSFSGFVAAANGGVWGCVVAFQRQGKKENEGDEAKKSSSSARFLVDVLVNAPADSASLTSTVESSHGTSRQVLNLLPPKSKRGTPQVISIPLDQVDCLSSIRVYIQKDLRPLDARQAAIKCVGEAVARLVEKSGKVPMLDPKEDMKIDDKSSLKLFAKLQSIEKQIFEWKPLDGVEENRGSLREGLAALQKKRALAEKVAAAEKELKAAHGLVMKEDLKHMSRVLRRLNYLNEQGLVTIKGRVAAAINSGHDLVLVELMFNGSFAEMSTEHMLAACSCFVCQDKMDENQKIPDGLKAVFASVQEAARRVAKTSIECRMEINEEEYVDSFRPTMMEVVVAWFKGMKFSELIKLTSIFEGAIVRSIRRLEELLRQLQEATKAIGDETMAKKFEQAREKIKRDVIFANSLYL